MRFLACIKTQEFQMTNENFRCNECSKQSIERYTTIETKKILHNKMAVWMSQQFLNKCPFLLSFVFFASSLLTDKKAIYRSFWCALFMYQKTIFIGRILVLWKDFSDTNTYTKKKKMNRHKKWDTNTHNKNMLKNDIWRASAVWLLYTIFNVKKMCELINHQCRSKVASCTTYNLYGTNWFAKWKFIYWKKVYKKKTILDHWTTQKSE